MILRLLAGFGVLVGIAVASSLSSQVDSTSGGNERWVSNCAGSRVEGNLAQAPATAGNQISRVYAMIANLSHPTPIGWKYITRSGSAYIQLNFIVQRDGSIRETRESSTKAPISEVLNSPAPYYDAILRSWADFGATDGLSGLHFRLPTVKPYSDLASSTTFTFVSCKQ